MTIDEMRKLKHGARVRATTKGPSNYYSVGDVGTIVGGESIVDKTPRVNWDNGEWNYPIAEYIALESQG